jgi:hypothetical protein
MSDLSLRIAEFKLDLEDHESNSKANRLASSFIIYWIDSAIRGNVQSLDNPKAGWDWIKSQYKRQDAQALNIALA